VALGARLLQLLPQRVGLLSGLRRLVHLGLQLLDLGQQAVELGLRFRGLLAGRRAFGGQVGEFLADEVNLLFQVGPGPEGSLAVPAGKPLAEVRGADPQAVLAAGAGDLDVGRHTKSPQAGPRNRAWFRYSALPVSMYPRLPGVTRVWFPGPGNCRADG